MEMFDVKFVEAVKAEVEKKLAAGQVATRKSIVEALGYNQEGAELAITVMFSVGLLPEYKTLQKMGIKHKDYVSASKAPKKSKKVDDSDAADDADTVAA